MKIALVLLALLVGACQPTYYQPVVTYPVNGYGYTYTYTYPNGYPYAYNYPAYYPTYYPVVYYP